MADQKISQLPTITGANMADDDKFVLVDTSGDATVATTRAEFFKSVPDVTFGDNDKAIFGAGSDLQIYHDGNHSWIKDAGSGNTYISSDGYAVNIVKGDNIASVASFIPDGPVNLYYAGSQKLATTSTGVDVTGAVAVKAILENGTAQFRTINANTAGLDEQFYVGNNLGDVDLGNKRGNLKFFTNTTEKMRIDTSGRVGIGVTDPIYSLEVQGEVGIELYNSSGGGDVLNFRPSLGDANKYNMSISSYDHSGNGVGPADGLSINGYDGVSFATGGQTTRQERLRIDTSGRVGIGTSSPLSDLHLGSGHAVPSASGNMANNGLTISNGLGGRAIQIGVDDTNARNYIQSGYANNANIANHLSFINGANETMRLTSTGKVGIGTDSPNGKTHSVAGNNQVAVMAGGDVSDPLYPAFGFDGQIGSNGGRGAGMYLPDDGNLAFSTAGSERMRIDSSGHAIIPAGVTLGTSAGVYAAANTLDDYEEGTFTAGLGDGTNTINMPSATYTKIGRYVTIAVNLYNADLSSLSTSGSLSIFNLPFTTASSAPVAFATNTPTEKPIAVHPQGTFTYLWVSSGSSVDYAFATKANMGLGTGNATVRGTFHYLTS